MKNQTTDPCCPDCLTGDVAVKVIDEFGFEYWFCADCWAAEQEFREKASAMLGDAARALEKEFLGDAENWRSTGLQSPGPENEN